PRRILGVCCRRRKCCRVGCQYGLTACGGILNSARRLLARAGEEKRREETLLRPGWTGLCRRVRDARHGPTLGASSWGVYGRTRASSALRHPGRLYQVWNVWEGGFG